MDKTTTAGAAIDAAAAIWQEEPCAEEGHFGLNSRRQRQQQLITLCPREVSKPYSFRAGNFTEDQKFYEFVAQLLWANTSIPDFVDLEKPIELADHTWEPYMGQPMVQKVPGTCALVACTKCVEVVNRLQHKKLHGTAATTTTTPFPCSAAPPSVLLEACRADGIWKPGVGAWVGDVLNKIRDMGGVPATTTGTDAPPTPPAAPRVFLPLNSWEEHRWSNDFAAGGLSPERVADLLYNNGPCVGVLWASPLYRLFVGDGDGDDALVYRSWCGRSNDGDETRRKIEERHPGQTAWHAVVCFGYRFRGGQMHVRVLDNQAPTGPRRWIHVEEFHALYTLSV